MNTEVAVAAEAGDHCEGGDEARESVSVGGTVDGERSEMNGSGSFCEKSLGTENSTPNTPDSIASKLAEELLAAECARNLVQGDPSNGAELETGVVSIVSTGDAAISQNLNNDSNGKAEPPNNVAELEAHSKSEGGSNGDADLLNREDAREVDTMSKAGGESDTDHGEHDGEIVGGNTCSCCQSEQNDIRKCTKCAKNCCLRCGTLPADLKQQVLACWPRGKRISESWDDIGCPCCQDTDVYDAHLEAIHDDVSTALEASFRTKPRMLHYLAGLMLVEGPSTCFNSSAGFTAVAVKMLQHEVKWAQNKPKPTRNKDLPSVSPWDALMLGLDSALLLEIATIYAGKHFIPKQRSHIALECRREIKARCHVCRLDEPFHSVPHGITADPFAPRGYNFAVCRMQSPAGPHQTRAGITAARRC